MQDDNQVGVRAEEYGTRPAPGQLPHSQRQDNCQDPKQGRQSPTKRRHSDSVPAAGMFVGSIGYGHGRPPHGQAAALPHLACRSTNYRLTMGTGVL